MEGKGRAFVSAVVFICFFSRCSAGPESNNKNELGLRVSFSVLPLATLYLLASFDIWLFSGGGLQQQARQGLDLLIGRRGGYSSFAVCILLNRSGGEKGKGRGLGRARDGWMDMNGLE
jgi:hypothetical protein